MQEPRLIQLKKSNLGQIVNKYIYTIALLLNAKAREPKQFDIDSKISEQFDENNVNWEVKDEVLIDADSKL